MFVASDISNEEAECHTLIYMCHQIIITTYTGFLKKRLKLFNWGHAICRYLIINSFTHLYENKNLLSPTQLKINSTLPYIR